MIGIELVRGKETKEPATDERKELVRATFKRGLLTLGCGPNVLRLMPPLVIDQEQADCALDILEAALTEVEGA
jgi:4-aminobutyrate aminotransferase-like enzyme